LCTLSTTLAFNAFKISLSLQDLTWQFFHKRLLQNCTCKLFYYSLKRKRLSLHFASFMTTNFTFSATFLKHYHITCVLNHYLNVLRIMLVFSKDEKESYVRHNMPLNAWIWPCPSMWSRNAFKSALLPIVPWFILWLRIVLCIVIILYHNLNTVTRLLILNLTGINKPITAQRGWYFVLRKERNFIHVKIFI
jgi:hypothetical protein